MRGSLPSAGDTTSQARAATGIEGLDDVLGGGFTPNRLYLIEGVPGSGKTTLALQFLLEGAQRGEPVLYVTLSETEEELRQVADSHGWSLDGITIRELVPSEDSLRPDEQYTMFHPSEVELSETTKTILADVERIKPTRVVFDSLSELRLLAANPLRYRRQILALKQFFSGRKCTVLLLDDMTSTQHDLQVQSIAHGVSAAGAAVSGIRRGAAAADRAQDAAACASAAGITTTSSSGAASRSFRGSSPASTASQPSLDKLASGIAELDALLGGGIERGTSTLIVGAAGTGKSSLAAQFVAAAAARGQNVGAVHLRREPPHAADPRAPGSGSTCGRTSTQGASPCSRSTPPSCRRASSRTPSAGPSRTRAYPSWSSTA